MKKKVFISIPMRGREKDAILKEMNKVFSDNFDKRKYELINENVKDFDNPMEAFSFSVKNMSAADIVFFAPGWKEAGGCVIEKMICDRFKKETQFCNESFPPMEIYDNMYDSSYQIGDIVYALAALPEDYEMVVDFENGIGYSFDYCFGIRHTRHMVTIGDAQKTHSEQASFNDAFAAPLADDKKNFKAVSFKKAANIIKPASLRIVNDVEGINNMIPCVFAFNTYLDAESTKNDTMFTDFDKFYYLIGEKESGIAVKIVRNLSSMNSMNIFLGTISYRKQDDILIKVAFQKDEVIYLDGTRIEFTV